MTAPWRLILWVFAFVCVTIDVILILAKATAPELAALLLPLSLAFYFLGCIVGSPGSPAAPL
jgi:hypothetical protein